MLDIKHIDDKEHKKLTKYSNKNILDFAEYLSEKNIPIWIRHVVVPTITDKEEYLQDLGRFIAKLRTLKALDILPYHNMAIPKYENLGLNYPLKEIPALSKDEALRARSIIFNAFNEERKKN